MAVGAPEIIARGDGDTFDLKTGVVPDDNLTELGYAVTVPGKGARLPDGDKLRAPLSLPLLVFGDGAKLLRPGEASKLLILDSPVEKLHEGAGRTGGAGINAATGLANNSVGVVLGVEAIAADPTRTGGIKSTLCRFCGGVHWPADQETIRCTGNLLWRGCPLAAEVCACVWSASGILATEG